MARDVGHNERRRKMAGRILSVTGRAEQQGPGPDLNPNKGHRSTWGRGPVDEDADPTRGLRARDSLFDDPQRCGEEDEPSAGSKADRARCVQRGLRALADALAPVLVDWWAQQEMRAALRKRYDCDLARGDVQCPYIVPRDGEHACCRFKAKHPALLAHETYTGDRRGPWEVPSSIGQASEVRIIETRSGPVVTSQPAQNGLKR